VVKQGKVDDVSQPPPLPTPRCAACTVAAVPAVAGVEGPTGLSRRLNLFLLSIYTADITIASREAGGLTAS
jgi:hypothetical protein